MCDQNAILRVLAPLGAKAEPCSATEIAKRAHAASRKQAIGLIGKLAQKKLIRRVNKQTGFGNHAEPVYEATKAGLDFVRKGKRVTSGPNGPLARPGVRSNTFRQRIWNALRISKKATLPQLIEVAREPRERDCESNALKFMTALVRAGVATRLPIRERGHALSSNGHIRFALLRDLGPAAPQAAKAHLVNLNASGIDPDEKFIPYGASK